jgi:hypothetical protein
MSEGTTVLELNIVPVAPSPERTRLVRPAIFQQVRSFVLDANRVTVHYDAGTCWLKTVDPNIGLRVMADDSVWVYRHLGNGSFARSHEIQDAWEMTSRLEDAVADCDQHGHAWSPDQIFGPEGQLSFEFAWCLICGIERVVSPDHSRELIWPADASLIQLATGGRLPRLHGPLFG